MTGAPFTFLYDGHCRLCVRSAAILPRLARPGAVVLRDFQAPGVLAEYPQVTHEQCMEAAQLVAPDGAVVSGLEAVVRAVMTRKVVGLLARVYYVPGLRFVLDRLYAWVAANRYRLMGRTACADGACEVHLRR